MGDEEARGGEYEREREREREGKMTWMYVGAGIITWWCLEKNKQFFSTSAFNRYIIDYRL